MEHELLSLSSDSWTDAQQPNPCIPTVIQGFAEHVCLPADDPIEDFSEEDMATRSMAAAGRSPNKHPRTGSSVGIAALLDRAAGRFDYFNASVDVIHIDVFVTSSSTVRLFATVPTLTCRFPFFIIVSSLNCNLSPPISRHV